MAGTVGPRSAPRSRSAPYAHVSPSVSSSSASSPRCVATPTTCQQPCSLSLSRGREYNMTDGHSRTNTVGHRAVRGRRMPLRRCCSALRARLTCVCVARFPVAYFRRQQEREKPPPTPAVRFRSAKPLRAASLRVSTLADSPDLCGGVLLSSLFPAPSPRPRAPSPPHATQHKPHRRRETRHMSGTTFEATNPDSRRRPSRATCRPSRRTVGGSAPHSGAFKHGRRRRGVASPSAARNNLRFRDLLQMLDKLLFNKTLQRLLLLSRDRKSVV